MIIIIKKTANAKFRLNRLKKYKKQNTNSISDFGYLTVLVDAAAEENTPKNFIKLPKLYIDKFSGDSNLWL